MPYWLKPTESIPDGMRRIVNREFKSALARLKDPAAGESEAAIHEARKSVKKIRAVLRLLRSEMGGKYGSRNRKLQAAGRKLSQLRDATVMLDVFDNLIRKYPGELSVRSAATIRRRLAARKKRIDREAKTSRLVEDVRAILKACGKRAEKWPLRRDGFPAVASGIETTYRRASEAMKVAREHPSPENFHEWRKRVQDHWYQTRLLSNLCGESIRAYARNLKKLQTCLGEDHNLEVLRERTPGESALDVLIGRRQAGLRKSALALGERIYEETPLQFTQRLKRLWTAPSAPRSRAPIPRPLAFHRPLE